MKLPRILKLFILTCLWFGTWFVKLAVAAEFTPEQRTEIQQIVHDYLINNPEVLVETAQALQHHQEVAVQSHVNQAIPPLAAPLFHSTVSLIEGNPQGTVVLVEFFDYQCSHCRDMAITLSQLIQKNTQLRVIYKQLPIFGANSQFTAKAALAASEQGSKLALAFHNALLKANQPLTQDYVLKTATEVGLNVAKLKKAMDMPAFAQELKANYVLANALGIIGTPAFIVANNVDDKNPKNIKTEFIGGATSQENLQQAITRLSQ